MKNSKKLLSFFLALLTILSVASAFTVGASAEDVKAPEFSVNYKKGITGTEITATVSLVSGGFNSLDLYFETSKNVVCSEITKNNYPDLFKGNTDTAKIAMVGTDVCDKPGKLFTVKFTVPTKDVYSIRFVVESAYLTVKKDGKLVNQDVTSSTVVKGATYGTYKISFDTNGGNSIGIANVSVGSSTALPTPVKSGYGCVGWAVSKGGAAVLSCGETYFPSTDITLYAVWNKIPAGHKCTYTNHYCKVCCKFDPNYDGVAHNTLSWFYVKDGKIVSDYTGLAQNENGWWYIENGKLNWDYTGLATNKNGTWYVINGKINLKYTNLVNIPGYSWCYIKDGKYISNYTGLAKNANGTWYLENGKVMFDFNGLVNLPGYSWCCIKGGKYIADYTGLATNKNGTWYLKNGKVQFGFNGLVNLPGYSWCYIKDGKYVADYTGLATNANGTWYVKDGKVQFNCNELVYINGKSWCSIVNGKYVTNYTGLLTNANGTWYVVNGKVQFGFNGLVNLPGYSWCYIQSGKYIKDYTGLAKNANGTWYLENGKVMFNFTGLVGEEEWYYISNGKFMSNYTGLVETEDGTWYVKNGVVQRDLIELVNIKGYSWCSIVEGEYIKDFTGLIDNANGTWYVDNGKVQFGYSDFVEFEDEDGNVYDVLIINGKVAEDFTGLVLCEIDGEEVYLYVEDGFFAPEFTGNFVDDDGISWYIVNGFVR